MAPLALSRTVLAACAAALLISLGAPAQAQSYGSTGYGGSYRPRYPGRGGFQPFGFSLGFGGYRPRGPVYEDAPDEEDGPVIVRRPARVRKAPLRKPPRQPVQAVVPRRVRPVTVPDPRYVPDEVLVEARAGVTPEAVEALARNYRLTRLDVRRFALLASTVYRYRLPRSRTVPATLAALGRDPRVASAQPNFIYRLQQAVSTGLQGGPSEPTVQQPVGPPAQPGGGPAVAAAPSPALPQYALDVLRLREAHRMALGGGSLVALLDSGVDANVPDLSGAVAGALDTLSPEAGVAPEPHGTNMAGAIAAHGLLQGVAPAAHILSARVFGSTPERPGAQGTSFHVMAGLDWAVTSRARIVNMSFAGPQDPLLARELASAAQERVILIAAAGNDGPGSPPLYPAADPNVIAVTASDSANRLFASANRGPYIGIAAPGVDVLADGPGGTYAMVTGTSVAAAHVSGIAALLLQANPGLDGPALRQALAASGVVIEPASDEQARLPDALALLSGRPNTSPASSPQASAQ